MYAIDALYADETKVLDNDGISIEMDPDEISGAYEYNESYEITGSHDSKFIELKTYNGPEEIKLLATYGITVSANKVGSADLENPMSEKYNTDMDVDMDLVPFEDPENDVPNEVMGAYDEYTFDDEEKNENENGENIDTIDDNENNNTDSNNNDDEYTDFD